MGLTSAGGYKTTIIICYNFYKIFQFPYTHQCQKYWKHSIFLQEKTCQFDTLKTDIPDDLDNI